MIGDRENIAISGDGSWRKRGYSSLQGIVAVIGNFMSKVLDTNIRSSFCHPCKAWESRIGTPEYLDWLDMHEEDDDKTMMETQEKWRLMACSQFFINLLKNTTSNTNIILEMEIVKRL